MTSEQNEQEFLSKVKDFWISFCIQMQSLRDIFLFLERTVLIKSDNEDKSSFWRIGLGLVRAQMKEEMKQRLKIGVLKLIEQDRKDEKRKHRDLIAKLIHVMLALDFYKGYFEDAFLSETRAFFSRDSVDKLQSFNVLSYPSLISTVVIKLCVVCRHCYF